MTGVPASTDMHFRNGAVAISFVATILLQLVEEGTVSLDDRLSTWLPEMPHADQVTLGQLASMTSGFHDYVGEPLGAALAADPFRQWTPEELIGFVADDPLWYEPGTNWNYAHTNYVILGLAIEKITGMPMSELMQQRVLGPLGLSNTADPGTPEITEPVLHAYSSERREPLGITAGVPFIEDSSFWNPSWTITRGAIQNTDIYDLSTSAVAIGMGALLTPRSFQAMTAKSQRAFGGPVEGCTTCRRGDEAFTYGLGVIMRGEWLLQNPFFYGYAAVAAYLRPQELAIAVAVTYDAAAFSPEGTVGYKAENVFGAIAAALAPDYPLGGG